ncbi:uncharacterized protein LOC121391062 [Gigantopelta aegis]|uniref:uncharacterized protein LOC121391062 n=1 Tax=Gigantopelta aegis TaxID=1735272 RepID=UPI001B88CB4F|nr:uncharacterized protein LOC121391062 [Gigantopelta aegis]XP_041378753.1 uncharacterized protein LOC121391062 [Gigantopelta aegis]XP_041378754.1 uncharacterized protein LOC121391062 [Gigantopelta aegis]
MKCRKCNEEKLRCAFPPEDLSKKCRHPRFYCMRCVMTTSEKTGQCPHPSCGQPVPFNSDVINLIKHTLAKMFREYTSEYTPPCVTEASAHGIIRVSVLTGDSTNILFNPAMTVLQLKEQIKTKLKHDVQKQKLLHHGKELQAFGNGGHQMTLSEYNIQPNETIHLVVLLYAIPDAFDHVVLWSIGDIHPLDEITWMHLACFSVGKVIIRLLITGTVI